MFVPIALEEHRNFLPKMCCFFVDLESSFLNLSADPVF